MSGILGLLIGRQLCDRYLVRSLIGAGAMGAVCRATDTRLEREVAVKVMTAASTDPAEQRRLRERFYREARAAARLRHPNVVTIHDFGTDPQAGIDFLVMELLSGEDLAARMARAGGPMRAHEALAIVREAAQGLGAGHRAGLVHRDVKPQNLFLVEERGGWEVKVLDFGIAQVASEAETLTRLTMYGSPHTPRYASPEQLRGSSNLTAASDVYSLALTALEMLGGRYPEHLNTGPGDHAAAAAMRALRDANPGVSPAVVGALYRGLLHDPAARFPHADAFAEALDTAMYGHRAPSPDRPQQGPPPAAPPVVPAPALTPRDRSIDAVWADRSRMHPPAAASGEKKPEHVRKAEVAPALPERDFSLTLVLLVFIFLPLVGLVVGSLMMDARDHPSTVQVSPASPLPAAPAGFDSTFWRTVARAEAIRASGALRDLQPGDTAFVVVLGSFTASDGGRARTMLDSYLSSGEGVGLANDLVYPELTSGYYALVSGPYRTQSAARAARDRLRDRAPDAFVRAVTFRFPE